MTLDREDAFKKVLGVGSFREISKENMVALAGAGPADIILAGGKVTLGHGPQA